MQRKIIEETDLATPEQIKEMKERESQEEWLRDAREELSRLQEMAPHISVPQDRVRRMSSQFGIPMSYSLDKREEFLRNQLNEFMSSIYPIVQRIDYRNSNNGLEAVEYRLDIILPEGYTSQPPQTQEFTVEIPPRRGTAPSEPALRTESGNTLLIRSTTGEPHDILFQCPFNQKPEVRYTIYAVDEYGGSICLDNGFVSPSQVTRTGFRYYASQNYRIEWTATERREESPQRAIMEDYRNGLHDAVWAFERLVEYLRNIGVVIEYMNRSTNYDYERACEFMSSRTFSSGERIELAMFEPRERNTNYVLVSIRTIAPPFLRGIIPLRQDLVVEPSEVLEAVRGGRIDMGVAYTLTLKWFDHVQELYPIRNQGETRADYTLRLLEFLNPPF